MNQEGLRNSTDLEMEVVQAADEELSGIALEAMRSATVPKTLQRFTLEDC